MKGRGSAIKREAEKPPLLVEASLGIAVDPLTGGTASISGGTVCGAVVAHFRAVGDAVAAVSRIEAGGQTAGRTADGAASNPIGAVVADGVAVITGFAAGADETVAATADLTGIGASVGVGVIGVITFLGGFDPIIAAKMGVAGGATGGICRNRPSPAPGEGGKNRFARGRIPVALLARRVENPVAADIVPAGVGAPVVVVSVAVIALFSRLTPVVRRAADADGPRLHGCEKKKGDENRGKSELTPVHDTSHAPLRLVRTEVATFFPF